MLRPATSLTKRALIAPAAAVAVAIRKLIYSTMAAYCYASLHISHTIVGMCEHAYVKSPLDHLFVIVRSVSTSAAAGRQLSHSSFQQQMLSKNKTKKIT